VLPAKDLIFIDESGAHLQMTPRYGRAYGQSRAVASAPYQHGNHITMISAISLDGIEAALYGEWAADGDVFSTFIEKCLCPKLQPRHHVIMDNVSFHKSEKVTALIQAHGAKVIFLPPYSPELNPIEEMWSKIKILLRKHSARNIHAFKKAIKIAYKSITSSVSPRESHLPRC